MLTDNELAATQRGKAKQSRKASNAAAKKVKTFSSDCDELCYRIKDSNKVLKTEDMTSCFTSCLRKKQKKVLFYTVSH